MFHLPNMPGEETKNLNTIV